MMLRCLVESGRGPDLKADNGLAFERKDPEMKSKLTRQFGVLAIALMAATGMAACDGNVTHPTTSQMSELATQQLKRTVPSAGECYSRGPVRYHGSHWTMPIRCDRWFPAGSGGKPAGIYEAAGTVTADWASVNLNLAREWSHFGRYHRV